jgi:hypothetical protein
MGIRQYIYTSTSHVASPPPPSPTPPFIKSETESPKVRIRQPHVKDWGFFFTPPPPLSFFLSFFLLVFQSTSQSTP